MQGLQGRRALVTGSSRGIGRAIALAFAREGADVAVHHHRSPSEAASVAKEIEAVGRRSVVLRADLVEPAHAAGIVEEATAALGALDILVNNAGENAPRAFLDLTTEEIARAARLNYEAPFAATQAFARSCRKPGARVVNVGSIAGVLSRPGSAAYGAAKAALHSLTRSSAEALAPDISVNAIAPGMIDTGTHGAMMTPEFIARVAAQVPMRRFGTMDEVAACALFLGSGPGYLTGQVIVLDGGIGNVYFR